VSDRVTAYLSPDEHKLIQLLRTAEADCTLEVHKRNGMVVNVVRSTIHRREFEKPRLREVVAERP
jgi:hypothetical protein